jgi:hypothetical protein
VLFQGSRFDADHPSKMSFVYAETQRSRRAALDVVNTWCSC